MENLDFYLYLSVMRWCFLILPLLWRYQKKLARAEVSIFRIKHCNPPFNRLKKKKNHMTVSTDAEKALDKTAFRIKT